MILVGWSLRGYSLWVDDPCGMMSEGVGSEGAGGMVSEGAGLLSGMVSEGSDDSGGIVLEGAP